MKDDYLANRILRDDMRAKRNKIKAQASLDNDLRKKSSLGDMELVPEHQDDIRTASLMRLQPAETSEDRQKSSRETIADESIFRPGAGSRKATEKSHAKEMSRINLKNIVQKQRQKEIVAKASPLKKNSLGIIVKKRKISPDIKDEEKCEETGEEPREKESKQGFEEDGTGEKSDGISEKIIAEKSDESVAKSKDNSPQPGGSGTAPDKTLGSGLLLCDYGSTSSDSD